MIDSIPSSLAANPDVATQKETLRVSLETPLAAVFGGASTARLTEYRGAKAAEGFSNASQELGALLTSAGVHDLGWRSFLRCSGEDRLRWLNGMVTNSVLALEENTGCYAFVLNAQGRIQGDLDIYRRANALRLETDRSQIEALTAFLDHYIIMDDVILEQQNGWTAIGVAGPQAAEKLAAAGLSVAALTPAHVADASWRGRDVVLVNAYSPLVARYEIWIEPHAVLDLWNALLAVDAVPCGVQAVEQLRILEGTLAYGVDIGNRDLPQETNQMRALHFSKGCYLGQEIVERIRSRGLVHRTFSGFSLTDPEPPARTALVADGENVGELTSVARMTIPRIGERVLSLGRIRVEALERKKTLKAGESAVTPFPLPFDFADMAVQP